MRILYIDIDSLRPDHLGCYSYHRDTSPNIDALAAEGVRFENVYASDTPCLPSRTSFFGGRFGVRTGVVNHGGKYADLSPYPERSFRSHFAETTLASVLRRAGYHASSISPFPNRHTAYQMTYGFTETYDTGKGGRENADEMFAVAKAWLEAKGAQDSWFLHLNFWDPHTPYDHPASYGHPFRDAPLGSWLTQEMLDEQLRSFGPHSAREVPGYDDVLPPNWLWGRGEIRNLADAKAHHDAYDTGVHYADHYIGKLFELLKTLDVWEDTAVLLSADHGENLGELNVWGDHHTADQITNRLPLIVRWPGLSDAQAGGVKKALHYHLDLTATLADLVGAARPEAWDGVSFAADLEGKRDEGREQLVLSHGAWSCQRAVRWEDYLLIRTYHTGLKDFPEIMLFNVAEDPHELNSLAAAHPELVGEGLTRLDSWLAEQMYCSGRGDPFWGIIQEGGPFHANRFAEHWQVYLDRLRATGRADHAERLEALRGRPGRRY